ncbi:TylF/MycF/NovP-related O-methyltransferase [Microvirga lenta]|uniref:TylF/MycF/NovP-related O-methyltransferase n=1 Tax=Microvirga lenta TaxID=2881337 RepID=UPI001CFC99D7|nr:TylF/MycF/NovP-related O-methyltransferase [Microvirga lenta]MCB5174377.1 TylF/MycF family methyltransferase [Microvirga lenta]
MTRTSGIDAQKLDLGPSAAGARVPGRLRQLWRGMAGRIHLLPRALAFINDPSIGRDYGIGRREKLRLLLAFARNIRSVENLCTVPEHLELAAAILRLPRTMPGDVVECGCYVGSMSVNLSLACKLVGRRLIICDSFQGLPPPKDYDRAHHAVHTGHTDEYWEGRFAASLDLVKDNLRRYGALDVCDFVVGFYDESLKDFDRPTALAFLDVDLIDSVKPCIEAIWPRMAPGSRMYVHEARNLPLVAVFYDNAYWRAAVGQDAPGFVGAGTGLPLSAHIGSEIGYAQKGAERERLQAAA